MFIFVEEDEAEEEAEGGNRVWRAWTILLVARMSSTCESVTGETKGSGGTRAPTTGEGVRVERGDGKAVHITTDMMLGDTAAERAEGEGPEEGGGGGAKGAGAAKATLPFGELQVLFFGRAKKGPGPSPSRTSRTNTNIQRLPLAMGQRGGKRARACCTRWVWNAGRKSTHIMCLLSSF